MLTVLGKKLLFPDPRSAIAGGQADGLVAMGGDFSVARLLLAYRSGIFPWTVRPITWWSPDPRAIFELEHWHVSRSLARVVRQKVFSVTRDQAFRQVMEGCAEPGPGRASTWVTPEFIAAYSRLHDEGHAHSVECWQDGQLAGGIYGVAIGGFFAGESMFRRADNASKVALHHLVQHLRERGFALFDTQVMNPATRQLGAINVAREDYLKRLKEAVALPCVF